MYWVSAWSFGRRSLVRFTGGKQVQDYKVLTKVLFALREGVFCK